MPCLFTVHVKDAAVLYAQVIGAFVKLGYWLPLMVDGMAAPQASVFSRVNVLVVLSAMLHAAGTPPLVFACPFADVT